MGSSGSKQLQASPGVDYSAASFNADYVEKMARQAAEAQEIAARAAGDAAAKATKWKVGAIFTFVLLIIGAGVAVYLLVFKNRQSFTLQSPSTWNWLSGTSSSSDLSIQSALLHGPKPIATPDITSALTNKISNSSLNTVANTSIGVQAGETITVRYQYPGKVPVTKTFNYGDTISITPPAGTSAPASSSWFDWFKSEVSANQLPTAKDASISSVVSASSAPLSGGKDGAYGYQFWVYVKDWNYKFGQEKNVLSRSDPTNVTIMNPNVTLHPTDNTLKVSVSIFPSSQNSSKTEPAPAGHSGSTDDVFVCDVPNIPLQAWTSVSITMFSRNLDVYVNGKLVKSCVMTGVPKPAAGDIELNKDGGFSGWMCGFYHYSKMLNPSDAQSFYASGAPCSVPGTTPSNYNITFGLFNTKGKEVNKYML